MASTLPAPTTVHYKISPASGTAAGTHSLRHGEAYELFRDLYLALILCLAFCAAGAGLVGLVVSL
jgi:hypothetical protein